MSSNLTAYVNQTSETSIRLQIADGSGYVFETFTTDYTPGYGARLERQMANARYERTASYSPADGALAAPVRCSLRSTRTIR